MGIIEELVTAILALEVYICTWPDDTNLTSST
jgi:hypothetical protein